MAASLKATVLPLRKFVLAVALVLAGIAQGAGAAGDDAALPEQMKKLNERIERLEKRNQDLEKRLKAADSAEQRIKALEEANARTDEALQSDRLSERDPELTTRLKAVEFQTLSMQKQARQIEALEGITVSASLTGVLQSANSGSTASGTRESRTNYRGDIAVSLPGGEMGDIEGKIFAHLRIGQGNGIELRPTYTSTPNTTAFQVQSANANPDDSFGILAQAWYQLNVPLPVGGYKPHSRESMRFTFGKIDPFVFFDQNVAADDESTKFLNNAFVHNPLLDSGGDVGADQYGFSPGFIAGYVNERSKPESWGASVGVFGSGPGANFSGSQSRPFVIGQLETSRRFFGGLAGNYRLYAWTNGRATNFDGAQARRSGWGASADQRVGDAITLFGRYGHELAGRVRFDRALTLGAEFGGSYWGRAADSFGVAAGLLRTSAEFRNESSTVDADGDSNPDFGFAASGTERIGELYYRFRVNKRFELSPDLQFIRRPGGNGSAPSVTVVGFRAKVGF